LDVHEELGTWSAQGGAKGSLQLDGEVKKKALGVIEVVMQPVDEAARGHEGST
jgi:hypothetical protein